MQKQSHKMRVGLIHNPKKPANEQPKISKLIQVALNILPLHQAKNVITKILRPEFIANIKKSVNFNVEDLEVHVINLV